MMGKKEECKKYMVKVSFIDEKEKVRVCFNDHPLPLIEEGDVATDLEGLQVSGKMLEKICSPGSKPGELHLLVHIEFAEV